MAKPIKLKRSSVPGKAPETNQLQLGELALNTYDGKLYTKTSANGVDSIVELSGGSGGGGGSSIAGITVGTYGGPNGVIDVGSAVTALRFAAGSGFSVTQGPDGATEARVSLNSTFKTWHVAGQQDLVAEGEDEITIEAGTGVTLTTTPTGTKKLKIDGFSGAYADLTGAPTLGTAASAATTDFATAAQGSLADSALQAEDIGVAVQAYDADLVSDGAYVHTDNNYTTDEKNKLAGIEAGAEVNVNADWAASSGDAQILNKPTLGTAAATDATAYATAAQGLTADSALQPGDNISELTNNAGYITQSAIPVQSVAGKTGTVTLAKGDVGLSNVDNTSDASKPISTATQTALDAKAPLASPSLTGTPTAPTATAGANTTQIASTAFVTTAVSSKQPLDADLTAIAGLTGTSGILKKTAADTWTLDTNTYLTSNQNITVSGDATGSGTTSISLTLGNSGVAAGTYNDSSVAVRPFTVDAKGRVTGIGSAVTITPGWSSITSKPTTVAGFGITDAAALASPVFTGTPAAPTAAVDTQTTQIATTAYVVNQGYLKSSTASSTYALISQIASTASQLEAEAGTNNTKMMTPLRVAQAIAALGSGGGGGGGGSSGPTYTDQMFLISAGVF